MDGCYGSGKHLQPFEPEAFPTLHGSSEILKREREILIVFWIGFGYEDLISWTKSEVKSEKFKKLAILVTQYL